MKIEIEPNDTLVIGLLGITSVYVYFEGLATGRTEANAATVYVRDLGAMTNEQYRTARLWAAQKTGVPADSVEVQQDEKAGSQE